MEIFGLMMKDRLSLLSDLTADANIKGCESLLSTDERLSLQQQAYPNDKKFMKARFHRAVQEILMAGNTITLSKPTTERVQQIISALKKQLSAQEKR
jgi:hypothetical protein